MTLDVYRGRKTTIQQQYSRISRHFDETAKIHTLGKDGWMDGWHLILRPFQEYFCHQDDGCTVCSGTLFTVEKTSPRVGIELGPLDQ